MPYNFWFLILHEVKLNERGAKCFSKENELGMAVLPCSACTYDVRGNVITVGMLSSITFVTGYQESGYVQELHEDL